MTFRVLDALPILLERLGPTINKVGQGERTGLENVKIMGCRTPSSQVLGLDVYPGNMQRVRLWIEREPPAIVGIKKIDAKDSTALDRPPLDRLADKRGIYLEVQHRQALEELLDWYA